MRSSRLSLTISLVILAAIGSPRAQHRLVPVSALRGDPALELMLRKLDTVGTFMMTTAHPDDENNGMLAYYAHGMGFRTALVSATRGEGGQNEIGPELFQAIGILRAEELAGVHKWDGVDQYFTRAYEFGFSFSVEETFEKWGKEEILRDVVRVIRAGARGYITKGSSGAEVSRAVHAVAGGDAVFSPRLAGFVLDAFGAVSGETATAQDELDRLSAREQEVMRLIARGYAYKEIARRLSISIKTVESHASSVLRKLQLSSRNELASWAARRRLL